MLATQITTSAATNENALLPLPGSFLGPPSDARLGPADPHGALSITIQVRRDAAPHSGVSLVAQFAHAKGLEILESNLLKRSLILRGPAWRMNRAFGVNLTRFASAQGEYLGRAGYIYLPAELTDLVEGVFGLDNRPLGGCNGAAALRMSHLTPPDVARLYDFPTGRSAAGQTIGILAFGGGYRRPDVDRYFASLGLAFSAPRILDIGIDGAANNPGRDYRADREVLMDICIASAVAPGAEIAVYFAPQTEKGWVDAIGRAVHPGPGDPAPSVLSICWYLSFGDDEASLRGSGVTDDAVRAVSSAFHDAGELGLTIFVASGDSGAHSEVDGLARVQYPASDPWVTACGGTKIGNVSGAAFEETAWHGSGGGVSARFPLPDYQAHAGVPFSVNDGRPGRGVPDIAGNAGPASGYRMEFEGVPFVACKTSAVAPLYAGLAALLNANLGRRIGFLNPLLYSLGAASPVFRDVDDGTVNGVPGYACGPAWDACTGWGSVRGSALLSELRRLGEAV